MRTFSNIGERVKLKALRNDDEGEIAVALHGEVTRICSDGRAWLQLDTHKGHRFSGKKVRALPEDCEIPTETSADRRRAKREAARPAVVVPEMFGRDHHSTLLYIETCCVDHGGIVDRRHMRCDPDRHPLRAHEGSRRPTPGSRCANGVKVSPHDDWDCVDDMIDCGWLVDTGGITDPQFMLTDAGWKEANRLRREKAERTQPHATDAGGATAGAQSRVVVAP